MTVVSIDPSLIEADERLFLEHQIRVYKWGDFLTKVYGFVNCDLGGILLVFFEDVSHSFKVLAVVFQVELKLGPDDLWWVLVLADLWEELMESLHTLWTENFIKDLNLV